jgi:hypothetical protein
MIYLQNGIYKFEKWVPLSKICNRFAITRVVVQYFDTSNQSSTSTCVLCSSNLDNHGQTEMTSNNNFEVTLTLCPSDLKVRV